MYSIRGNFATQISSQNRSSEISSRLSRRPPDLSPGQGPAVLRRSAFQQRTRTYQYVARQQDCQACPVKDAGLPPRQKRRYFSLTMYHSVYLRARARNRTAAYRRERRRRQTIAEGTFALLDRLGWDQSRFGDYGRWTARGTWQRWPTTC